MSSFKIVKDSTPNKTIGRKKNVPDMIVSHITAGSFAGAVSWLKNKESQASAHFVVARDGRITQLVNIEDSSWCNGTSVTAGKNTHYSKSTLKQVRDRKTNANYYTVTIEHEGFSGQAFTDVQMEASIWLHKYIISEVKRIYGIDIKIDRNHIVGHYQINPITKPNCPGKLFPWDKLMSGLQNKEEVKPKAPTYRKLVLLNKEMKSPTVENGKSFYPMEDGSRAYVKDIFEVMGLKVQEVEENGKKVIKVEEK